MENTTMFRAIFALTDQGNAELNVMDTAGRLMTSHTKHNVKTASQLRSNLWWARTTLGSQYVLAEDAHWQRGADGQTWTAAVVLPRAYRYRLDMECGHSAWAGFPPIGRRTTCLACSGLQTVTQYLDSAVGALHVIMSE
ncbi:hypothetical protein AB0D63_43350 [Kitasatospora sp. NPDC048343]|uniref:hypothetical protein n=1 Tax=Kitasatospora sp. NPDC048343 TaxID=3154717 RepID=UPI0033C18549